MSAGFDMASVVRHWLREEEHDNADRVLEVVLSRLQTTPQLRRWPAWPARRPARLSAGIRILALAAAVVVAVVGYALLPGVNLGPGATPSPSPSLIARGSVVEHDSGRVDFEATRTGSVVTGRMTIAARDGRGPITIDLQCARDGDDGILMIGGYATAGNDIVDAGDPAWIVLQRGTNWARVGGASATEAREDCLANLDWWLGRNGGDYRPMPAGGGTVEFGPALPAPTLIARGRLVEHDWGVVEFEAMRLGEAVTGSMTVGAGRGPDWPLTADFECLRTTEDGLVMIGAVTTGTPAVLGPWRAAGGRAGLVLDHGSLLHAELWVGGLVGIPATLTDDCIGYLDGMLAWSRSVSPNRTWGPHRFLGDQGTIEFGA